jgi:hypothetical protein
MLRKKLCRNRWIFGGSPSWIDSTTCCLRSMPGVFLLFKNIYSVVGLLVYRLLNVVSTKFSFVIFFVATLKITCYQSTGNSAGKASERPRQRRALHHLLGRLLTIVAGCITRTGLRFTVLRQPITQHIVHCSAASWRKYGLDSMR